MWLRILFHKFQCAYDHAWMTHTGLESVFSLGGLTNTHYSFICIRFCDCGLLVTNYYSSFCIQLRRTYILIYRARRTEARIQQMLWKVNYSDIVFLNTVCATIS